mgnify:FL=1
MLHRITYLLSSLPLFWISWRLFELWIRPEAVPDAESWIRFGVALLLLEFVLLHSGVFVVFGFAAASTLLQKIGVGVGLTLFYGLFVIGFALGTESRAVLEIYGLVMVGRFATLVVDREKGTAAILGRSVLGVLFYIPLMFLTVLFPIPRLGIVGDFANAARTSGASGVWVDDPQRPVAARPLFFLAIALCAAGAACAKQGQSTGSTGSTGSAGSTGSTGPTGVTAMSD